MGSCGKQHSKRLKAEYVEAHAAGKADYSRELLVIRALWFYPERMILEGTAACTVLKRLNLGGLPPVASSVASSIRS
eukprot:1188148-Prorocentrum_minimum.AAC.2